jgi:NAD(P)-dependent dehydrogenase (short-subunit alcohol dehydrogenase family)
VEDEWTKETVRLIEADGGTVVAQHCDVTEESDVIAAIDTACERFGRLDVMFNNVGITTPRPGLLFEDHTTEDWERLMNVNFRSVFWGCKHAVTRFKAQGHGGVIVNTGSVAGLVGWGGTVYGASKGGVIQLSPAAMPLTNFSVPGAARGSEGMGDERAGQVGSIHPLGRPITAEDCAAAALYLVSDQSRNVTGTVLPVDGGYTAR